MVDLEGRVGSNIHGGREGVVLKYSVTKVLVKEGWCYETVLFFNTIKFHFKRRNYIHFTYLPPPPPKYILSHHLLLN